jgi:hypothetical protein
MNAAHGRQFRNLFLIGVGLAAALLLAGLLVFRGAWEDLPAVLPGLGGSIAVLILYGLLAWFWLPRLLRRDGQSLLWSQRLGLAAGAVFAIEILLEYILLPADNSRWGLVEFGLVFALYLAAAVAAAWQTRRFSRGLVSALWAALAASLIWLAAVLLITYLFHGTDRQTLLFQAEGNFADFQRSGMSDFEAFILSDFYGAAFYHLLLVGPLAAGVLGSLGAGLSVGLQTLAQRMRPSRSRHIKE